MATYKKLTDVEVMEKTTENSMAIIEENGVLKRVPAGGFGGSSFVEIKCNFSTQSLSCDTHTGAEVLEMLQNNQPVHAVLMAYLGEGDGGGAAPVSVFASGGSLPSQLIFPAYMIEQLDETFLQFGFFECGMDMGFPPVLWDTANNIIGFQQSED